MTDPEVAGASADGPRVPLRREVVVDARPIRTALIAKICSAVILVVFVFTAIVMRHDNAGVHFVPTDQLGTLVVGVILAAAALVPTRPRLHADANGVRIRAFLGAEKNIGWDLITRVDFPKKLRFARIVLPGEEALALYAVQRWDHESSVAAMTGLRELFANSRS
ncbi:PH domain-containing protein [Frankineae bacterium MT45]|nr:PH domain-containing protein [Frankineae bacterium MT45]